jgi:hypothetical protein
MIDKSETPAMIVDGISGVEDTQGSSSLEAVSSSVKSLSSVEDKFSVLTPSRLTFFLLITIIAVTRFM